MSELFNPNQKDRQESLPNPNLVVGHSGDLGLEEPVNTFNSTTLSEANERGLLIVPEDVRVLTKQRKWLKPALIALGFAGSAGAGAVIAGSEDTNPEVTATTSLTLFEAPNPENTGSVSIETESARPLYIAPVGDDPEKILDALLYNLDCYRSFGDIECAENFVSVEPGENFLDTTLGMSMRRAYEENQPYRDILDYFEEKSNGFVESSTGFDDPNAQVRTISYRCDLETSNTFRYYGTYTLEPTVNPKYGNEPRWLVTWSDHGPIEVIPYEEADMIIREPRQ